MLVVMQASVGQRVSQCLYTTQLAAARTGFAPGARSSRRTDRRARV